VAHFERCHEELRISRYRGRPYRKTIHLGVRGRRTKHTLGIIETEAVSVSKKNNSRKISSHEAHDEREPTSPASPNCSHAVNYRKTGFPRNLHPQEAGAGDTPAFMPPVVPKRKAEEMH
jgi:hypothetical protein